jgi:sulfite reductase alpha subunit-like flavoprotein
MRLPADLSTPVVVVGPGTGIAPFRAFVQERLSQQDNISRGALANGHSSLVDRNGILVFFGCRSRQSDYYFQEEWENLHESKQITFDLAASRDQEDKVYVQHRILEQSKLLWDYLGLKNGVLYISG